MEAFPGVQVDDPRLAEVLSADAKLLCLYEGTLHAEGPIWDPSTGVLFWSDVPNRRLLALHPDGHVEAALDNTYFMNGNALDADGRLVHCEHGRRCISRSDVPGQQPEPIVTHYQGRRLNSPNDLTVATDGAIWFTDPTFGILMPNQGSVADPELDHRSVYRFDPRDGSLARMADFEQPNGVFFARRTAAPSTCPTPRSRLARSPMRAPARRMRSSPLTSVRTAPSPTAACSAIRTTDIQTGLRSTSADGFGRRLPTESMFGRPPGNGWASSLSRRRCRTAASAVRMGERLFMAATKLLLAIDLIG